MTFNEKVLKFLRNEITYEEIINSINSKTIILLNERYLDLKKTNTNDELDLSFNSFNEYIDYMNKVEDILFKKLDLYEMLYYCMNPIGYIEKNMHLF